jgi:hypothetical protein
MLVFAGGVGQAKRLRDGGGKLVATGFTFGPRTFPNTRGGIFFYSDLRLGPVRQFGNLDCYKLWVPGGAGAFTPADA